jgi:RsiW-degrading membrane proteinase PrsW (M82 family)
VPAMPHSLILDFLLAMLPGMAWLAWFLHKDRYEPEPRSLVAKAFAYGMGALLVARLVETAVANALHLPRWVFLACVVAPLEECLKFAVVRFRFFPDPEFNEPVDGIVYATTVGIGFSTLENAFYMYSAGEGVLVFRGIASTLVHLGCSGLTGYALGRLKFGHKHWLRKFVLAATVLHAVFDVLVSCGPGQAGPGGAALVLALLCGFLFWLYSYLDLRIDESLARSPFRPGRKTDSTDGIMDDPDEGDAP